MRGFRPGSKTWDAAVQIYAKFGAEKFRHADLKPEGINIHHGSLVGMHFSGVIEIPSDVPGELPKRRYSGNSPNNPTEWRLTPEVIQKFEAAGVAAP